MLPVAVSYAATMVLFVAANKLTTSANSIFLQDTAPLYVLLASPLLLREESAARDVGFMAVVAVGMAALLRRPRRPLTHRPDPAAGNVWRW